MTALAPARLVLVLVLGFALTGCSILRGGSGGGIEAQPPDRPERFEFFMQPGSGAGAQAEALAVDTFGPDTIEPGTAFHIATVVTPLGSANLVEAEMGDEAGDTAGFRCVGMVHRRGGSSTCSAGTTEDSFGGIPGWGSDGIWNESELYGLEETASMEVTVLDGTRYTIHTHQRWGLLVWSAVRGEIQSITYLDAAGQELGTAP